MLGINCVLVNLQLIAVCYETTVAFQFYFLTLSTVQTYIFEFESESRTRTNGQTHLKLITTKIA